MLTSSGWLLRSGRGAAVMMRQGRILPVYALPCGHFVKPVIAKHAKMNCSSGVFDQMAGWLFSVACDDVRTVCALKYGRQDYGP